MKLQTKTRFRLLSLPRGKRVVRAWMPVVLFALVLNTAVVQDGRGEDKIQLDPILVQAELERVEGIRRAMPSAVSVFVPGGGGGGSGVLISPEGYALTNFHVSSPAGTFMRCGLSDGQIYDAVIVGIDPVGDLALIRLLGKDDFPFAELGNSRAAQVGDWCMVIGNPFLLASNLQPTVTWGILSGVGRYQYPSGTLLEYGDCLQTDASINPGILAGRSTMLRENYWVSLGVLLSKNAGVLTWELDMRSRSNRPRISSGRCGVVVSWIMPPLEPRWPRTQMVE